MLCLKGYSEKMKDPLPSNVMLIKKSILSRGGLYKLLTQPWAVHIGVSHSTVQFTCGDPGDCVTAVLRQDMMLRIVSSVYRSPKPGSFPVGFCRAIYAKDASAKSIFI